MSSFLLMAASALIIAIGGTPLVRYAALQLGILDQPSARKIHSAPVPLMGGAAIYVAFIAALALWGERSYVNEVVGIFVGATLVSLVGALDDSRGVGSYVKLLVQVVAACILIFSGVQVRLFDGFLDIVLTLFWVVGVTNAFNLLDNMDGLSSGVATISAAFFTLLAAMSDQYLVGTLAAALCGACIGFLVYNWNPARVFMGDTGSLFLGFLLAAVGIKLRFPANTASITWMIPILVLALPVFDTALVCISRLRRGKNPLTTAGKDHVSHRLALRTGSQREAVLLCYLITGGTGLASVFLTQANLQEALIVGLTALALAVFALWKLEFQSN
ncbi:MAG: undecaprenyl/decaprenyl-phosphate alpha-N-acetylglucosaminyl 1-phosphate transferase [Caldilineaceae bacterium SB0661_bin_32]|uniref:Undecaprenyl/decaprenyl-phosphate alpha-N-acetylglucosaminyl 1-phosphate transferase n=1 Tax=Caldilineaceae bacterium SB0661_bin_32 TaxID=2605255 RepID=A0A6B1D0T1_9CHLR|nr:undecaprenyl/decaprenyl-phosphate alpha-N-acetylglucosaminyl 1-phosphate transferase [Caldilineaceae bacterium SB0661_bin_32]